MKKAIPVIAAVLVLAAAFGVRSLVAENADSLDTSPDNDSLYYFSKNMTGPAVDVFAENGGETSDISPAAWKVTSPEGNTIYMVGSMHVLTEECYPLPDYLKEAYEQADILAPETNNVDVGLHMGDDVEFIRDEYCEKGKTLKDYLSEDVYSALSDFLKGQGKDIEDYKQFHPWYVYDSLSDSGVDEEFNADIGLDRVLKLSANIDGKEIVEVESFESKLNLSRSFPDEVYPLLIKQYCEKTGEERLAEVESLYEAWKSGDQDGIYSLTYDYDPSLTEDERRIMDEYNQIFMLDRNEVMAQKAEEFMTEGQKVLFCVGVSHYVGEGGIIDLLEKDGYTCERIDPAAQTDSAE